jgi:hypothetical protein
MINGIPAIKRRIDTDEDITRIENRIITGIITSNNLLSIFSLEISLDFFRLCNELGKTI